MKTLNLNVADIVEINISSILTSCGINTGVSIVAFTLYSILRKQPSFVGVFFAQRIAQAKAKRHDNFCFDRFVPSASWIKKAWEATEDELFASGGLDAVVFVRIVVFSIRIFALAATICLSLVLPLNYYGQQMKHKYIAEELAVVFTIQNVKEGSKWVWAHCLALYVITSCSLFLLYWECKSITKLRLAHVTESLSNASHFTVLVRGIPWSQDESYSETVAKFFSTYYASSYISHQMVYQSGTVGKLMGDAEKMYMSLKSPQPLGKPSFVRCGLCGGTATSFKILASESQHGKGRSVFGSSDLRKRECAAAFVFFRTRYAALVAAQALQSPNPMLWVTDPAPEPCDIYWSNLCVPYSILWIRRIFVLVASVIFVAFFFLPVGLTQGLVHIEKLEKTLPFMTHVLKRKFMVEFCRGYLPSAVLMLFLYTVPPMMFLFATLEGSISRSGRKRSACVKVLYFMIWNVFFGTLFAGAAYDRFDHPREIPNQMGRAIPQQGPFFTTYVMTSGWAGLSCELLQPYALLCNLYYRFIQRKNVNEIPSESLTFPYHTEVPRVLLFGLLGFTCSVFAPLILPFLLIYFLLAYLVYRNQLLNVYQTKYQSGGLYWPIAHNTTIFSLVLTQIIALGLFGLKKSPVALGFTIPLIIATLLFNEYCRERFHPAFRSNAAEVLIQMDQEDEHTGRMEEIHSKLREAYCQFIETKLEDLVDEIPGRRTPVLPPLKYEEPRAGRRTPVLAPSELVELHGGRRNPVTPPSEFEDLSADRRNPVLPLPEFEDLSASRRNLVLPSSEFEDLSAGRKVPVLTPSEFEELHVGRRSGRRNTNLPPSEFEEVHAGRKSPRLSSMDFEEVIPGRKSPVLSSFDLGEPHLQ